MSDKLATESALLKIEALAAAAGFLNEPDEQPLYHELVALIEVVVHQAARGVFPQALGGHPHESVFFQRPQRSGVRPECQQSGAGGAEHVAWPYPAWR